MGWISKQVRPTKEIFDDLVKVFGKKWNIAYMPSENGSPYEYFSDYIRDYYEVTLRQCDMLCKMIKEHYNIKTFYYNEVEAARNKKRIKVRITDKNRIFHEFEDKTAIGVNWGDPIVVDLSLKESEFKALILFMGNYSDLRHDCALLDFMNSICITKWHKRVLLHNFKTLHPETITIEIL